MIVQLTLILIAAYLFYTRIWLVYSKIHYYKKQGVPFHMEYTRYSEVTLDSCNTE
jgi:hypothetical protein